MNNLHSEKDSIRNNTGIKKNYHTATEIGLQAENGFCIRLKPCNGSLESANKSW